MSITEQHSVSVAAIVVNADGRILVVRRRDNGKWEPPGGVLEVQESILDGLHREVYEETGLQIEPERLTGTYKNMPRGIIALVFRARVRSGKLRTSDETSEVAWWSRQQILDRFDEAYAVRVVDALDNLVPAVRAHDGIKVLKDKTALP